MDWPIFFCAAIGEAAKYAAIAARASLEAMDNNDIESHRFAIKAHQTAMNAYKAIAETVVDCIEKEFEKWYFDGVGLWMKHYERAIKLVACYALQANSHARSAQLLTPKTIEN